MSLKQKTTLAMTVATPLLLAGCGSSNNGMVATYDPDEATAAIAPSSRVNGVIPQVIDGDPPAPSDRNANPSAPTTRVLTSPTSAEPGDPVTVEIEVDADNDLQDFFAQFPNARSFFQAASGGGSATKPDPRTLSGGGAAFAPAKSVAFGKASLAEARAQGPEARILSTISFTFDVPSSLEPGRSICLDFSAQDTLNLVSNVDGFCVQVTAPAAVTEPPAEDPPAEDPPAEDPPAEDPPAEDPPAEDPPAEDPPAEDPPAEDPPAEDPPAEDPPTTGGSSAACYNSVLVADGSTVETTLRNTSDGMTSDLTTSYTMRGTTTFNGQSVRVQDLTANCTNDISCDSLENYLQVNDSAGTVTIHGLEAVISAQGFTSQSTTTFEPPRVFFLNANPGDVSSQQYTITTETTFGGQSQGTFTSSGEDVQTYEGRQSITVPAGTFDSCRFSETSTTTSQGQTTTSTRTFWTSVGSGLPLRTVTGDGDVTELVRANVNGVVTGN